MSEDVRHWYISPRSAVSFLIHGATIDLKHISPRRNLSMPGLSATVGKQIDAVRRLASEKAVSLIRRKPGEMIKRICAGYAQGFEAKRALDLGFTAENTFD